MAHPTENPAIETVEDLGRLVRAGFSDWSNLGDVRVAREGDLLMFAYTPAAQYAGRWNAFEQMSRGLILDGATGEVVARPFDKFFNWGEGGQTTDAPIDYVMEKVDGSLIVCFDHDGRRRAATRGSFTSGQAQWAQQQLDALPGLADVPSRWTLLFEAVYPENRIVVDYRGRTSLFLLAMRDRESGEYAPLPLMRRTAAELGLPMAMVYDDLDTIEGVRRALEGMSADEEGYVAVFRDGRRFKFKSAAYLELHKLVFGLTFRSAIDAVQAGAVEEVRRIVPEELRVEFDGWVAEVEERVTFVRETVAGALAEAAAGGLIAADGRVTDRKAFALWAAERHPELRVYLFAALDGKPLDPIIFRMEFKDRDGGDGALLARREHP
jgi:RNA ligase